MNGPRYSERAARFLREAVSGEGPPPSADARAAAISEIERAIVARRRRSRVQTLGMIAGAVAVAAATLVGVARQRSGDPASTSDPSGLSQARSTSMLAHPLGDARVSRASASSGANAEPTLLKDGEAITQGTRVTTEDGARVLLSDKTGTELALGGSSDMSVVEEGPNRIYALGRGTLDLHVAKLKTNERLLVHTTDAEVEVRGTRFHVQIVDPASSCDGKSSTRVTVDEGVVVVRRDGIESRVAANESWPLCPKTTASSALNDSPVTLDVPAPSSSPAPRDAVTMTVQQARGAARGSPASPASSPSSPSSPSSTLSEQNDLFADGIDRKHRGDSAGAVQTFEKLLNKYPAGPLAENAAAERLRILRASDPNRAGRAAHDYLARWPNGFAKADAEAVLKAAP